MHDASPDAEWSRGMRMHADGRVCGRVRGAEGGGGRSPCAGMPIDRRELYDREGGLAWKEEDAYGDGSVQRVVRGVNMWRGDGVECQRA